VFVLALPALLAGPLLLLAAAVVALCSTGPLGWLAAVGLVVAVIWASAWSVRRVGAWWRTTRAPDLEPGSRQREVRREVRHNG
jgi:hypothetical protein